MADNTALAKLCSSLEKGRAYLIENPLNLRYFLDTDIDTGVLLLTGKNIYFLTDFRYIETAKTQLSGKAEVILQKKLYDNIAMLLKLSGISSLELEAEYQTAAKVNCYKKCCENIVTDGGLDKLINGMRSIKSESEIGFIKAAQRLTDDAFSHILGFIKPGVKEREIALEIEFFMRKNGAQAVSFDLITITGKKTSLPHGVPSDDIVKSGDFVTLDIGCKVGGYCSDMTRTVAVGNVSDEMKKVYDTVLRAQTETLGMLREGVICSDADKTARDIIYSAGYKGCFGHSTGHSVGLFIHETPTLSPRCSDLLKSGMVVTVEPGIYLENRFGVRIEDMALIKKDGIENLTASDKRLIVL